MNVALVALALLGFVGEPSMLRAAPGSAAEGRSASPRYDQLADAPKDGHHGRFTLMAGLSPAQGLILALELQSRDEDDRAADPRFKPVWRASVGFQLSRGAITRGGQGGLGWYYLLSVPNRSIACTLSATASPRAGEAWQKIAEKFENGD